MLKQQNRVVLAQRAVDAMGRRMYRMMKRADVEALYEPYKVAVPQGRGGALPTNPVKLWLEWRGREVYEGLDLFVPGEEVRPGWLNLWEGWGVEARGDWRKCRRILHHIAWVICGGDRAWFRYVVRWLAVGVQQPHRKVRSALVMRGPEGIGKGTLAQLMMRIYGQHAVHLTQQGQVTGRFNSHLLAKLFAFIDEAFFAGDRSGEGTLKALITEEMMMVEAKGVDAFAVRNRTRVMMATNEDFAVRAGPNARRLALPPVTDRWGGDVAGKRAYFDALHAEIEGGGLEAFMALLLRVDVKGFNEEEMPASAALVEQKVMTLRGPAAWWLEVLSDGVMAWADGYDADRRNWVRLVDKGEMYAAYARWAGERRSEYGAVHPAAFWKLLRQFCPLDVARPRSVSGGGRPLVISLPTLRDARAAMAAHMRTEVGVLFDSDEPESEGGLVQIGRV
ncbi:DNA primase [Microcystis phage MJing1]|nr:DNA primase [Microcystis phage MJing1]